MAARITKTHSIKDRAAISAGMRRAHKAGVYDHLMVGTRPCDHCGTEMKANKGKRFCSAACVARGTAKLRSDKMRLMTNEERRLKAVLKRRIMHYRGKVTMPQLLKWLGCSLRDARIKIESKWRAGMSWDNYGKWQIDHIKACAEFVLTDEAQAAQCFHVSNLQPLWRPENQEKENRRKRTK